MDGHDIRMRIKALIEEARDEYSEHEYIGDVDQDDVVIEAMIHPELFEIQIRVKEVDDGKASA